MNQSTTTTTSRTLPYHLPCSCIRVTTEIGGERREELQKKIVQILQEHPFALEDDSKATSVTEKLFELKRKAGRD